MEKHLILTPNQKLEEHNGYNVVLTFANEMRLLNKEEQDEIVDQTMNDIFGGDLTPDISWKAWIQK